MKKRFCWLLVVLTPCVVHGKESDVYTLYRSSVLDATLRVHVATFDTSNGQVYNAENCFVAARLFVQQPGTKTVFWCEPGRFRKTK
jgi:hypothetical protein